MRTDFSLANDLAAKNPQKLAELQAMFLQQAEKYHVLPMDDRVFERLDGAAVGRPDLMARPHFDDAGRGHDRHDGRRVHQREEPLHDHHGGLEVPQGVANGTIIAQGGRFGGWSLYVKDGVPAYGYNFLGLQQTSIVGEQAAARRARRR